MTQHMKQQLCLMLAWLLCSLYAPLASSQSETTYLPVEQAFTLEYGWTYFDGQPQLQLRWNIAENYYLYRDQIRIESQNFGNFTLPEAQPKTDEYFGDTYVYYDSVTLSVPLTTANVGQNLDVRGALARLC